jgi:mannose-6-phosphate isomerase class I
MCGVLGTKLHEFPEKNKRLAKNYRYRRLNKACTKTLINVVRLNPGEDFLLPANKKT